MSSAEYPGARVVVGQLLRGYNAAYERFEAASREEGQDPTFLALFEALNWAVALDDFIREAWRPQGKKLDWAWRELAGGDEMDELMNGVRYARNLVHHHWADALQRDQGFRFPVRFPMVFFTWAWRHADELPPHPGGAKDHVVRNRAAYERRLAGVRASDTLLAVRDAFSHVGIFLDAEI
jgi:hypothetical protein